jgi:formylglycine-generating enzyme required for sulfatase activity
MAEAFLRKYAGDRFEIFSDGRENLEAGDEVCRMVRGGSFDVDRDYARCAFRGGINPYLHDGNIGFRVVVYFISPSSAV